MKTPKVDPSNALFRDDLYKLNRQLVYVTSNYPDVPDIDEYGIVDVPNQQVKGATWTMSFSTYGLWLAYKAIDDDENDAV